MHIDTEHNFPELIAFRDQRVAQLKERLIVRSVGGRHQTRDSQTYPRRNQQKSITNSYSFKGNRRIQIRLCHCGARRDEEKARAKERIFSFRDAFGQWDPKKQRPELWNTYNTRIHTGEHIRAFPISNWTELDIWEYIEQEKLDVPSIYFSHTRDVVRRDNQWLPVSDLLPLKDGEKVHTLQVRVRTIGDISCTGCVESNATTVTQIIEEISGARVTERGSRADDKHSETSMEDRKREGYF
jgi:sulfate adenylyltransferase subunit 2